MRSLVEQMQIKEAKALSMKAIFW
uniref:Uncharacterized protein n=1 Tax=Arundo donax TaxID=35708 RepID=A0A0A9BND2_ARUDO